MNGQMTGRKRDQGAGGEIRRNETSPEVLGAVVRVSLVERTESQAKVDSLVARNPVGY